LLLCQAFVPLIANRQDIGVYLSAEKTATTSFRNQV
jgi:hypothetical protein